MNIFVLHSDPIMAAKFQCDKHVIKMVTETAQILSMVLRFHGVNDERLYKESKSHVNHPVIKWARENRSNFEWTVKLGISLSNEYTNRYKKNHKAFEKILIASTMISLIPPGSLTPFVQCMPIHYQMHDPVEAYREFYRKEKSYFAEWKHSEIPFWFKS